MICCVCSDDTVQNVLVHRDTHGSKCAVVCCSSCTSSVLNNSDTPTCPGCRQLLDVMRCRRLCFVTADPRAKEMNEIAASVLTPAHGICGQCVLRFRDIGKYNEELLLCICIPCLEKMKFAVAKLQKDTAAEIVRSISGAVDKPRQKTQRQYALEQEEESLMRLLHSEVSVENSILEDERFANEIRQLFVENGIQLSADIPTIIHRRTLWLASRPAPQNDMERDAFLRFVGSNDDSAVFVGTTEDTVYRPEEVSGDNLIAAGHRAEMQRQETEYRQRQDVMFRQTQQRSEHRGMSRHEMMQQSSANNQRQVEQFLRANGTSTTNRPVRGMFVNNAVDTDWIENENDVDRFLRAHPEFAGVWRAINHMGTTANNNTVDVDATGFRETDHNRDLEHRRNIPVTQNPFEITVPERGRNRTVAPRRPRRSGPAKTKKK